MASLPHRLGQPREVQGRRVYLDDHVRPQLAGLVAAHDHVFVVVSEPGRRAEYTTELAAILGTDPEGVGRDHLYRLHTGATERSD